MRYLGLALYAEGPTDYRFLSPLLRRLTDDLCLRLGRDVIEISDVLPLDDPAGCDEPDRGPRIREAALAARGAFSVLFVHTDGAGDADAAHTQRVKPGADEVAAGFEPGEVSVVAVIPVRETEAWILADGDALRAAFGTTLTDAALGLPSRQRGVEAILKPGAALKAAFIRVVGKVRRRCSHLQMLEAISLRVRLDRLRGVPAFQRLEEELKAALTALGYLRNEQG